MEHATRIAASLERIADQQSEILAELRRLNATLTSLPVPADGGTYGAGLVIRTTDGFRALGAWEVAGPPHKPDCECSKCREARLSERMGEAARRAGANGR